MNIPWYRKVLYLIIAPFIILAFCILNPRKVYEQAKKDWWKKYDDYLAITKSEQLHQESEQKDETSISETEQSSHQQSPQ